MKVQGDVKSSSSWSVTLFSRSDVDPLAFQKILVSISPPSSLSSLFSIARMRCGLNTKSSRSSPENWPSGSSPSQQDIPKITWSQRFRVLVRKGRLKSMQGLGSPPGADKQQLMVKALGKPHFQYHTEWPFTVSSLESLHAQVSRILTLQNSSFCFVLIMSLVFHWDFLDTKRC